MKQRQGRQANWTELERQHVNDDEKWDKDDEGDEPEMPKPRRMKPRKHRGGAEVSAKKRRAAEREGAGEKESSRERQLIEEAKKKTHEGQAPQPSQPSKSSDEERPGKPQHVPLEAHETIEQRINNLRRQREVQEKMKEVLLNAYEKTYGATLLEITEFGRDPEEIQPGDLVIAEEQRAMFDRQFILDPSCECELDGPWKSTTSPRTRRSQRTTTLR